MLESLNMSTMTIGEDSATEVRPEDEAEAMAQRWAISLNLRSALITLALEIAGLEITGPGQITPLPGPKPKPRIRLSAMRILASLDRQSVLQRKLDLLESPTGEPPAVPEVVDTYEVSAACAAEGLRLLNEASARRKLEPPPPPPPEPEPEPPAGPVIPWKTTQRTFRKRWAITKEMRGALIVEAASICGFSVTPQGDVEPIPVTDETPKPCRRIVLSALRLLATFDRISLEERRVELRAQPIETPEDCELRIDPETAARLYELLETDRARFKAERSRAAMAQREG
jgi:hypothetical protein